MDFLLFKREQIHLSLIHIYYRVSRMSTDIKISEFMTPKDKLVTAPMGTTLKIANDIIWDHKLNSLPIVDEDGRLCYCLLYTSRCV